MKRTSRIIAAAILACVAAPAHAIIQTTVSVEDERVVGASYYVFDVHLESSGNDVLQSNNPETAMRLDTPQLLFNFSSATALTVTGARITSYFDWSSAYGDASGARTGAQLIVRGYRAAAAGASELLPRVVIDAWERSTAVAADLFEITHGPAGKTRLFTVRLPIADNNGLPAMEIDVRSSAVRSSQSEIGMQAMSVVSDGAGVYRAGSLTRRLNPIQSLLPRATITARSSSAAESVGAIFDVQVPDNVMTDTVIAYRLSSSDADAADFSDFGALPGEASVTLPMGTSRAAINVAFADDSDSEPEETFVVTLLTSDGVPLHVQSSASSAIAPSDPVLDIAVPATPTSRGQPIVFTVSLSRPSDGTVRFMWEFSGDGTLRLENGAQAPNTVAADYDFDGDGMPDGDYPAGTVTVPFGRRSITISVGTYNDPAARERRETYYVEILRNTVFAPNNLVGASRGIADGQQFLDDVAESVISLGALETLTEAHPINVNIAYMPFFTTRTDVYFRIVGVENTTSIDANDLADRDRDCFGETARCGRQTPRPDTQFSDLVSDIRLSFVDDDLVEPEESFRVILLPGDGYELAAPVSATGTIVASDRDLMITAGARTAADEGETLDFIVSLSEQSVPLTSAMQLTYRITGTDAVTDLGGGLTFPRDQINTWAGITGDDFEGGLTGAFMMASGARSTTVTLTLRDDGLRGEAAEQFAFAITSATGGGGPGLGLGHTNNLPPAPVTATINAGELTARLAAVPVSVSEGGVARIVAILNKPDPTADTEIEFDIVGISDGFSEAQDLDVDASNFKRTTVGDTTTNTVVIARGEVTTTIEIQIQDDALNEGAESFYVQYDVETMLPFAAPTRTRVTIAASDPVLVSVARLAGDTGGAEGTSAVFVVTLSGAEPAVETVVAWEVTTGAGAGYASAADFVALTGEVRIAVGSTTGMIYVPIEDDAHFEPAEFYTLTLRAPTGADVGRIVLIDPAAVTAQIPENDHVVVSASVYLQGAYEASSPTLRTGLINALRRWQPYGVAPWNYPVTTTVPFVAREDGLAGVTQTIVDWVLLELRTSTASAGAAAAIASVPPAGARAAGLLLHNGRIAGINEEATTLAEVLRLDGVRFGTELPQGENVYVMIHHRNHLSVMSAEPATDAACETRETDYCVDFRNRQSYDGCAQWRAPGGRYMMVVGDVNRSGRVSWGDDALLLDDRYQGNSDLRVAGYDKIGDNYLVDADLNFDGMASPDEPFVPANNLVASECGPRP